MNLRNVTLAILLVTSLLAQKQFEVVSVKPSAPDGPQFRFLLQAGGGVNMSGMTAKQLIAMAYEIRDFQVTGGPAWIDTDHFDIIAKGDGDGRGVLQLTNAERSQMRQNVRERLRHLLSERFGLQTHQAQKGAAVYALVQAPKGHKLKASDGAAPRTMGDMRLGRGLLESEGAAIDLLARSLSEAVGKPVLDKTGLTGEFRFKLEWTPDTGEARADGPSLFTALQEQLGLKLEAAKAPVDQLVIDRIEKPTVN